MVSNVQILILMMYAYHLIILMLHSQERLSKASPGKDYTVVTEYNPR